MFPEGTNTYVGLAATAIAMIAQHYGYQVSPTFQSDFAQWVLTVTQGVGLLYAAYGPARAVLPGFWAKLKGH